MSKLNKMIYTLSSHLRPHKLSPISIESSISRTAKGTLINAPHRCRRMHSINLPLLWTQPVHQRIHSAKCGAIIGFIEEHQPEKLFHFSSFIYLDGFIPPHSSILFPASISWHPRFTFIAAKLQLAQCLAPRNKDPSISVISRTFPPVLPRSHPRQPFVRFSVAPVLLFPLFAAHFNNLGYTLCLGGSFALDGRGREWWFQGARMDRFGDDSRCSL